MLEAPVEVYFLHRLLEEVARAEAADDPQERSAHLQACRYYSELLLLGEPSADGVAEPS